MTDERKFAILFAATILAARKFIDMDPDIKRLLPPVPNELYIFNPLMRPGTHSHADGSESSASLSSTKESRVG